MKKTKYILLMIGIMGMLASIYGYTKDHEIANHLIGFICGTCLVFGYFELNKANKKE